MESTASRPAACRSGFTLIEMSIVLVIIGLIVGGILVGRDMIRQAELRSVISDVDHFKAAVNTFRLKYNCLPGDCLNATDFFGLDSNGCPPSVSTVPTGTCNGNGDGRIDWDNSSDITETFFAWQQLALAGLAPGSFPGFDAAYMGRPGVNIPASRIDGVGYTMGYFNFAGNIDTAWDVPGAETFSNRIDVGTLRTNGIAESVWATVYETADMDTKIDDGRPLTGSMTVIPQAYSSPDGTHLGDCAWVDSAGAYASDTIYNTYDSHVGDHDPADNIYGPACSWVFTLGM